MQYRFALHGKAAPDAGLLRLFPNQSDIRPRWITVGPCGLARLERFVGFDDTR
jgi:hypothetical protein